VAIFLWEFFLLQNFFPQGCGDFFWFEVFRTVFRGDCNRLKPQRPNKIFGDLFAGG
jgi:hypothetical protein